MRYVSGVLLPLLLQCLFVFLIIRMNTGNGSWLGLGALLLGLFAIPATAIINFFYVKRNKPRSSFAIFGRCLLMALLTPLLTLPLMLIG